MLKSHRIIIALAIFVSGMALIPFVAFPSEQITWRQFADAYEPPTIEASIENFAFVPKRIMIITGADVRWTNNDGLVHTVTSDATGVFDSGNLADGDRFKFRFETPGIYTYHCTFHPSMTGAIVVSNTIHRVYLPVVAR